MHPICYQSQIFFSSHNADSLSKMIMDSATRTHKTQSTRTVMLQTLTTNSAILLVSMHDVCCTNYHQHGSHDKHKQLGMQQLCRALQLGPQHRNKLPSSCLARQHATQKMRWFEAVGTPLTPHISPELLQHLIAATLKPTQLLQSVQTSQVPETLLLYILRQSM